MKCKRFASIAVGLICLAALSAAPALAQGGFVESGYAILQAVDVNNDTVAFKGNSYLITPSTELLNIVGMPGHMGELEAMTVLKGVPDRDTGSKVYFEADFDHRLLKLHIVDEIPK